MRNLLLAIAATSLAIPVSFAMPGGSTSAEARTRHYNSRAYYRSCRHSSGTTGLVAGGVAGAVIGSKVIGGGLLGAAVGAGAGALGGRAVDRTISAPKRCRYVRR